MLIPIREEKLLNIAAAKLKQEIEINDVTYCLEVNQTSQMYWRETKMHRVLIVRYSPAFTGSIFVPLVLSPQDHNT